MKAFSCGDVVPGCVATFEGDDEDAILRQVAEHAERDHGMADVSPAVVTQVREHIREV